MNRIEPTLLSSYILSLIKHCCLSRNVMIIEYFGHPLCMFINKVHQKWFTRSSPSPWKEKRKREKRVSLQSYSSQKKRTKGKDGEAKVKHHAKGHSGLTHTCTWPSSKDDLISERQDLWSRKINEKDMQVYPYLVPHKSFLNVGEVFSTDLSEVQTQNERQRVSRKRWEHASCFENLAKPSSIEKRKWIMFSIELFWGSIFEGEGVSYLESKVWGKLRNKSHAFFEFMKPGFALFWPYCSGRAKSGRGSVLAVDIGDFRCQRSAWFHER